MSRPAGIEGIEKLTEPLSARVLIYLRKRNARRDPRRSSTDDTLVRLLEEHGRVPHRSVRVFEEAFGGLTFDKDDSYKCGCGARVMVEEWNPGLPPQDPALVPIGFEEPDGEYLMDARGHLWYQDHVLMPEPVTIARDFPTALERRVLLEVPRKYGIEIDGLHGALLAERLGVPSLSEASDAYASWWVSRDYSIAQELDWERILDGGGDEQRRLTKVGFSSPDLLDTLLVAVRAIIPQPNLRTHSRKMKQMMKRSGF